MLDGERGCWKSGTAQAVSGWLTSFRWSRCWCPNWPGQSIGLLSTVAVRPVGRGDDHIAAPWPNRSAGAHAGDAGKIVLINTDCDPARMAFGGEDYVTRDVKTTFSTAQDLITNGPYADVLGGLRQPASDWRNRPVLVFVKLDAGMPGLTQGKEAV